MQLLENAAPPLGEEFVILTAQGIDGRFGVLTAPAFTDARRWGVVYAPAQVRLVVRCAADMNWDGSLNFFDVQDFLTDYTAQDPAADLTGDDMWNFLDVLTFLDLFDSGCEL